METTISSLPEGSIRLRDGRQLAYAEYGDPQGKPVFFFHGTPGSRLFHHPDVSVAASTGARIIAIDRPGFGRSEFKAGRELLDWPNDVVQLADALNIERFAVMGYSGGGPYAAVCASSIPDRLTTVGLVSSIAPLDNPEIIRGMQGMGHTFFSLERHLPPLARFSCRLMCTTWRQNPDLYYRSQINGLRNSEESQTLLPKMKAMLTADFLEAVRAGTQGITWDLELLARPWGFHLHAIVSDVYLWHGESDTQAPLVMGKRLASAIPHCRATFFPGEGHWAIYSHWQEILTTLVQTQMAPHEEIEHTAIAVTSPDNRFVSEIVVLPECPDIAVIDAPADSSQGLQPAREVAEVIPTESAEGSTKILADALASVPQEPEMAQEAPKPASRKTTKRRTAAIADGPAKVHPEPKPEQKPVKPVSKNAAAHRAKAVLDARSKPSEKAKPARDNAKLTAGKTAAQRTAAHAGSPSEASNKGRPTQEKAKTAARKTAKRPAAAPAAARTADSGELKPLAKATAKKPAKPRTAVIEPLSVGVTEGPYPASKPAEPTSKKDPSGRKAAKEAVLV